MILADYRCAIHGDFEATVEAPAPDDVPCPHQDDDDNFPSEEPVVCGTPSPWVPAPIRGRVKLGEVHRGPNERPPNAMSLDTRKLGEGQPIEEYRAEREKIRQEFRKSEIKDFKENR